MSKRLGNSGFIAVAITVMLLASSAQQAHAILPRPVLKSFFQSGDKPTASQFAAFIDSSINFVDDRKLIGLKVYDPQLSYAPGDTAIFQRIERGSIVGAIDRISSSTGVLEFGGLAGLLPNDPFSVDVAHDFAGQVGFMGIKLETPTGEINYGYMQMSMDVPSGLIEDPPAINVDYIVYNEIANQPITAVAIVPLPTTAAMGIAFIPLMLLPWLRRRLAK